MKLNKDELIQKINEKVMDEDVKIELMEDITDSFEVESEEKTEVEDERVKELEEKYKNLQEKYKERFLKGSEVVEEEKEDETEELKEEEVINVKEI